MSCAIRANVARRGRSELSACASLRVTFHGQLVSEQRRARRLSAPLIVKINGNQLPHSTRCSLPSHPRLQPSLSPHPVCLCCLYICLSFPLMCFCSSLANACCLAICYPTAQLSLHYRLLDLHATTIGLKSYTVRLHNAMLSLNQQII